VVLFEKSQTVPSALTLIGSFLVFKEQFREFIANRKEILSENFSICKSLAIFFFVSQLRRKFAPRVTQNGGAL
jgi:hypothetical protein